MTPRRLIEPARLAGSALLHTQSDERLVDLARAGNDRAFEAIVSRYRRPLLRYCGGLLPPERAEDAVQQAFLNAYRAMTSGEAELNLRPWLYRIAHNASLNLLRQNGWTYEQIPEDFDGVIQPPQATEQRERIREVVRAVQDLPERQRNAMVLRELEGRSYEEIAAALGVTGGAVRQLLNRARTTLRATATAITPSGLVTRLAEPGLPDAPIAARIAELSAGAGGAATLAKLGTAVVVAGAVAGGVAAGPLHHRSHGHHGPGAAQAAHLTGGGSGLGSARQPGGGTGAIKITNVGGPAHRQGGIPAHNGTRGPAGSSGPGPSGGGDHHSGSGSSGSGDGGSYGGGSSGSGHDGSSSGSGSGDSGHDGSSGSGSSGSGDSGSSGSSTSGPGPSGSGSGDGETTLSGSGSTDGSSGSGSDSGSGTSGRH
jgi:RNA polymerase sigma factor (sigma-70 family)